MKAQALAARLAVEFERAHVPEATFEAEYLVRHAAGIDRAAYFAGAEVGPDAVTRAEESACRRLRREPSPYITGTREFYGLAFLVTSHVLIPRPETELLVEVGLREARAMGTPLVVDVGTGSGCVAVALALNTLTTLNTSNTARPRGVVGVDISRGALAVAGANAARLGAKVDFVRSDLAVAVRRADIVLANLPYVPTHAIAGLCEEVSGWEPRLALDGGTDGLALVRRLIDDCGARLRPRLLALEVGFAQAAAVSAYAEARGGAVETVDDLAGIPRVVCARWR